MEEAKFIKAFDTVLHVPNIEEPEQLIKVVIKVAFFTINEINCLYKVLKGRR